MVNTEQTPGPRIGVKPYDTALRCEPFDSIMEPSIRIGEGTIDIGERAGMRASDLRQNSVERHGLTRPIRMNEASLRKSRRRAEQCRREGENEQPPEHALF